MSKLRVDSIDLMKLIGSILIFALHCDALGDWERASFCLDVLLQWAVPFFFLSSSFFLCSKSKDGRISKADLLRFIKRIGFLYLIWLVYNIPSVIAFRFRGRDLSQIITWLLLLKQFIFSSSFAGSWYLSASIVGAVFLYWAGDPRNVKPALWVAVLIQLICISTSVYGYLLPKPLTWLFINLFSFPLCMFSGCFYFLLGKYLYLNLEKINRIPMFSCWVLALLGYGVYLAEVLLAKHYSILRTMGQSFGIILAAAGIFCVCLKSNLRIKNAALLRKLSIIVYCGQSNLLLARSYIKAFLHIDASLTLFATCVLLAAILSVLVLYIRKKEPFPWTRYII